MFDPTSYSVKSPTGTASPIAGFNILHGSGANGANGSSFAPLQDSRAYAPLFNPRIDKFAGAHRFATAVRQACRRHQGVIDLVLNSSTPLDPPPSRNTRPSTPISRLSQEQPAIRGVLRNIKDSTPLSTTSFVV